MPTNFLDTPLVYSSTPQIFGELIAAGRQQTIRFVELGDSQATTPGGFGEPWNFGFNKAMARWFGAAPETRLNTGGNFGAFGSAHSQQGNWGVAGRSAISPAVSTTPLAELLPIGSLSNPIQAVQSTANYQSGQLAIFLANNISATHPMNRNSNYFVAPNGVRLRTHAFTRSGASPITIGAAYNATHAHNFTMSDFQTNIDFGQNNASLAVVTHLSNLMTAPTSVQYLQCGWKLTSGTGPVEIYGGRFVMEGINRGAVLDSWGLGGSSASAFYTAYQGASKMLAGSGPYHCALLSFGANDMTTRDQAQYKADIAQLITWIRTSMGNSTFPVIICTDYPRTISLAADRTRFESYPVAAWELANELPGVLALNLQLACYQQGWTEADATFTGLTDRGAWSSAAVAYVANDYVWVDAFPGSSGSTTIRGRMFYKCVSGHTSSATNGPVDSQFWVPISRLTFSGDGVHSNFFAGDEIGQMAWNLITSEAFRIVPSRFRPWPRG